MLGNFFRFTLRHFQRNKWFTVINIAGLALGIAACLVILLYVADELSYDRYNEKADRIVRVFFRGVMEGGEIKEANVMPPVAQALKSDFPEVLAATRIRTYGIPRLVVGSKIFREDKFAFVDPNFFQVFTLPLIRGDAKTALDRPNTIVITRTVAERLFGKEDPIGKTLISKDGGLKPMIVTGEIEDVPANSHFHFGLFASMTALPEAGISSWMSSNFFTYLVLPKGYDYRKLEAKLPAEIDKYIGPQLKQGLGISLEEFRKKGNSIGLFLQPLTDIHLHSDLTGELEPNGNIDYVYIFSAVAIFMLLIACINFMNLSTAAATRRAREVGVRKVLGSLRGQLIRRFLGESLLLTASAFLLAIGLVYLALPAFNDIAGRNLSFHWDSNPGLTILLIALVLFTGLLSGSYPAFFLSAFRPIAVLKGRLSSGGKSMTLRSGLVVFQFFISISLIVGTAIVYDQLSYIHHKKLGYDKDQVIVLQEPYWLGNNFEAYRQRLLQDPRIASITTSGYLPAGPSYSNNFMAYGDGQSTQLVKSVRFDVDYDYIPTLDMEMATGRNFSRSFGADSSAMILNQAAATAYGWGENAVGHTVTHSEGDGVSRTYHVIGVVKDFNFRSLHQLITPLVMTLGGDESNLIVKARTKDLPGLLATMQNEWKNAKAEMPFSYSFLDDRFNNTYKSEQNIGRILGIFAGLTIFVACLGLFGLATFTAAERTREIGIRKVLGAGTSSIVTLLSKDFLRLVALAFLIAAPVAWLVMNKWLQDFAYRITIPWWIFAITGVLVTLITLLTIGFRALKAASANPVDSLHTE
ncbi:MAG TPA: ABC transporter permease [Puia sp.]|jgi:putative ABC transport system permease protein|nr:ABC transporter permease [Puia sp.]